MLAIPISKTLTTYNSFAERFLAQVYSVIDESYLNLVVCVVHLLKFVHEILELDSKVVDTIQPFVNRHSGFVGNGGLRGGYTRRLGATTGVVRRRLDLDSD